MESFKASGKHVLICTAAMIASIFLATFVGAFFGVPSDVEVAARQQARFDHDLAHGVTYSDEELDKIMGAPSVEPPHSITWQRLMTNSLLWRPWLVFPFVSGVLLLMRPRVAETVVTTGAVFALLLILGQVNAGSYLAISVVLYLLGSRYFIRGDVQSRGSDDP